jgi:hypothetical protein
MVGDVDIGRNVQLGALFPERIKPRVVRVQTATEPSAFVGKFSRTARAQTLAALRFLGGAFRIVRLIHVAVSIPQNNWNRFGYGFKQRSTSRSNESTVAPVSTTVISMPVSSMVRTQSRTSPEFLHLDMTVSGTMSEGFGA